MFQTDWIDEKIKNSFNNTSNILTTMYSRSMPDLSAIGTPKKDLEVKETASDRSLQAVEIIDTEAQGWHGYPSTIKVYNPPTNNQSFYHSRSVPDLTKLTANSKPEVSDDDDNDEDEDEDEESNAGAEMTSNVLDDYKRYRFNNHHNFIDNRMSYSLNHRDDLLVDLVLTPRSKSKGFSTAEEYKKILTEDRVNKEYHRVNSLYQPSYMNKRTDDQSSYSNKKPLYSDQQATDHLSYENKEHSKRPVLDKVDSLESFRFYDHAVEAPSSVHSADQYQPSQKDGSDGAMSEPVQPVSSHYAPVFQPTTQTTYDAHAMRDSSLRNRLYYASSSQPPQNTQTSPIYTKSSFLQKNLSQHSNDNDDYPQEATHKKDLNGERLDKETNFSLNQRQQQKQLQKEQQRVVKTGGYADLAMKREELKANLNSKKRPKRRIEAKSLQHSNPESTYNQSISSPTGVSPQSKASKSIAVKTLEYSDKEVEDEVDPKGNTDRVMASLSYPSLDYSAYSQHLQRLMEQQQQKQPEHLYQKSNNKVTSVPAKSSERDYPNLYGDSPHAKQYFSKSSDQLPPLKGTPPKEHSPYQYQVTPLGFKLYGTDMTEDNATQKNGVQRQKEYTELLRQNYKELPANEKYQVRSWNLRNPDENVYIDSKRAAALEYANNIPKPVLREHNSPSSRPGSSERENLVGAIEVMKKRHEEEKKAIEQMRAEIQQKIQQERAGKTY